MCSNNTKSTATGGKGGVHGRQADVSKVDDVGLHPSMFAEHENTEVVTVRIRNLKSPPLALGLFDGANPLVINLQQNEQIGILPANVVDHA